MDLPSNKVRDSSFEKSSNRIMGSRGADEIQTEYKDDEKRQSTPSRARQIEILMPSMVSQNASNHSTMGTSSSSSMDSSSSSSMDTSSSSSMEEVSGSSNKEAEANAPSIVYKTNNANATYNQYQAVDSHHRPVTVEQWAMEMSKNNSDGKQARATLIRIIQVGFWRRNCWIDRPLSKIYRIHICHAWLSLLTLLPITLSEHHSKESSLKPGE